MRFQSLASCLAVWVWATLPAGAQAPAAPPPASEDLQRRISDLRHEFDQLDKAVDDLLWYQTVGDVAYVDKVELTGPPVGKEKKISVGSNDPKWKESPLRFKAYVFIPRSVQEGRRYPVLVFPHGGVHSNFKASQYHHIVRELVAQGYLVIAPEYRGSTGYGKRFYQTIDYGGLEVADAKACRDFLLENYSIADPGRVGILGWSHGGLITLMNLFNYPEAYQVGYAGVPVSDLIVRMGNKTDRYRALYEVDYHIGRSAHEDLEEYKRRSPTWNAHKLQTPLLIHTNTSDADVTSTEVKYLIKALKAAGKSFEYQIYEDMPGGHAFDRIDTRSAREVRLKVYRFLARYLEPPHPFPDLKALSRASYRF